MFVSSYSTFINTINTNRMKSVSDIKNQENDKTNFSSKLKEQNSQVLTSKLDTSTPINYISNYKSFANKQKLQQEDEKSFTPKNDKQRFAKINSIKNAKDSYEINSKIFPRIKLPHITLSSTQRDNEIALPKKLQETMVNTYIQNDKYFQITA